MEHKTVNERLSCFLAQPYMIAVVFFLAAVGSYLTFWKFAVFLLVAGILLTISSVWGNVALRDLTVCADASVSCCYPGEEVSICYELENQKAIPLLWLDFVHKESIHGCVQPQNGAVEKIPGLHRREALRFVSVYEAKVRGKYVTDQVILRSGDGFGLVQMQGVYPVKRPAEILVYPAFLPVSTQHFMKNVWTGTSGSRGEVEDVTLLRGVRDYAPTDSWKRIDWRMAARCDTLQTKLYEKIRPCGILFVFDVQSYYDGAAYRAEEEKMLAFLKQQEEEEQKQEEGLSVRSDSEIYYEQWKQEKENAYQKMEQCASVIGSLMTQLDTKGMASGIMLPQTATDKAVTILPSGAGSTAEAMQALAAMDADEVQNAFDTEPLYAGSLMQYRIYLFTKSSETAWKCPALADMDETNVTLVVSKKESCQKEQHMAQAPDGRLYRIMDQEVFYDDSTFD